MDNGWAFAIGVAVAVLGPMGVVRLESRLRRKREDHLALEAAIVQVRADSVAVLRAFELIHSGKLDDLHSRYSVSEDGSGESGVPFGFAFRIRALARSRLSPINFRAR